MGKNLYICSRKPIVRFTERKRVFSLSVSVKLGHFHEAIKSDNGGRMLTWSVLFFFDIHQVEFIQNPMST